MRLVESYTGVGFFVKLYIHLAESYIGVFAKLFMRLAESYTGAGFFVKLSIPMPSEIVASTMMLAV